MTAIERDCPACDQGRCSRHPPETGADVGTVKRAMWPTRCSLCGGWVHRGEAIARHPSTDNRQRWGHPDCVAMLRGERAVQPRYVTARPTEGDQQ